MTQNRLELRFLDMGTPDDPGTHELGVFVDGYRLGGEHWLDLRALRLTCVSEGAYWLFNCDCREPGCAGIYEPLVVVHPIPGLVVWRLPCESVSYAGNTPLKTQLYWRSFQFDATQYLEAIEGFSASFNGRFGKGLRLRHCHNRRVVNISRSALGNFCRTELAEAKRLYRLVEDQQVADPKPGW